jgi:hypothetical protein
MDVLPGGPVGIDVDAETGEQERESRQLIGDVMRDGTLVITVRAGWG